MCICVCVYGSKTKQKKDTVYLWSGCKITQTNRVEEVSGLRGLGADVFITVVESLINENTSGSSYISEQHRPSDKSLPFT